eukprot:CAMPEP_0183321900 /NCGR_PEP_ID=MMETSP0160_2-20130417/70126_1 /TAXON_ID=2839 ORGANISM="Odontella Sinensis, Strain Grunow 1884" /NCGR_SAMPLE_ID=MMETSP0160_2 /ASSEMBLY_ACC=CAM_ASM_000250 /LENGTH=84 /DNA_ID=CAMNT_0025488929 /DNA_START=185 /DNA_END=435 /DNA_ORIENTATION=+
MTGQLTLDMRSMLGKMSRHARAREGVRTLMPEVKGECNTNPPTSSLLAAEVARGSRSDALTVQDHATRIAVADILDRVIEHVPH